MARFKYNKKQVYCVMINSKKTIYYMSIPAELKRLGLTQAKTADMLGCSLPALTYRIRKDKPTIHWAVYGIANFLECSNNG